MDFIRDLFSPAPISPDKKEEVERFVVELVTIGKTDDFLSERPGFGFNMQCRHIRTRQIGQRLHEMGGFMLMDWVFQKVRRKLGKAGRQLASHLEYAWDEIGDWKA